MMEEVLLEAVKSVDIVQNNSFWMYPNVYAYRAIKHLKKIPGARLPKLVNAPRGTLASWALNHHKLQKRLFGFLAGQYAAMKATDMWHATCKKEYEEIRAAGFTQPVAIVPIGMDIPNVEYAQATGSPKSGHRVAFFGRLHKVKNIDMLVKAWHVIFGGECDKGLDDWELVIAGPDGGVRGDLEAYIADHRIPRVRFVGEINGPAKYEFLSQADLYVLPSKTENFGITLAEALACGTPALGSRGTPWEALNEWRCGSWGFSTAEELAVELEKLMRVTDAERRAMGCRGQELIRSRYSWAAIGQQMKCAYQWLLDPAREARPDWVLMD